MLQVVTFVYSAQKFLNDTPYFWSLHIKYFTVFTQKRSVKFLILSFAIHIFTDLFKTLATEDGQICIPQLQTILVVNNHTV